MVTGLLIILGLILLNGLFSMSEIAIISSRRSRLEKDGDNGSKGARVALRLSSDPNIFLSTIQIGITLIGIITGVFSGDKIASALSEVLEGWGVDDSISSSVSSSVVIVVVTYFTLVLGELVPKRIGQNRAEAVARIVSRPILWLSIVTKPFVWILARSTEGLVSILGLSKGDAKVTEDEVKMSLQEAFEDGEVKKIEQDIVERVFLMGDLKVSSIMTHRSDVVWVDADMSVADVRHLVVANLFECYPVCRRSMDEVVGVVMLKDILTHYNEEDMKIHQIMLPPVSMHINMSIYDGMALLKSVRCNIALVYDEFGVCQGVISFHDILESLIGFVDESEVYKAIFARADGVSWLVDGQCSFYDFMVYFELEDSTDDSSYNTVSGLLLDKLCHIPMEGEIVSWRNFDFEVVDMDGARIDKILVKRRM